MIEMILTHIEEKKKIYQDILTNNRNSIVMDILLDVINNDVTRHIQEDVNQADIPSPVISRFYIGAVLNVGMEWLKSNNKYTKDEVIHYLDLLIPNDLNRK